MNRILITILIAMSVGILSSNTAQAAVNTTEIRNVTIVDFKISTDGSGMWYGALWNADGDSVKAIKFTAVGDDYEDYFASYGSTVTMTLNINTNGYTGYAKLYSAEYSKFVTVRYSDYTDASHIVGYCQPSNNVQGMTMCELDGDQIQAFGFIVNGETIKIRSANAYSVYGSGWLVQNGNLIRYAVENKEENPTPTPTNHTIVLPLIIKL